MEGAMRIGIYVRVSKAPLNVENQLHDLQTFASRQGWEVAEEYVETVTGSGRQRRTQFERMMLDASQHKFDLLLFWSLDRLSREGISKTLRYLENLKQWGIGWRSFTQPWLDTGNDMVTGIVLSVISAMAEQERKTLIERTKAGLRTAKRAGKILGRPRRDIDWPTVHARVAKGESVRSVARSMKVSHSILLEGL
jgi:DNA invertase Pin-like site-specific DNA recombinase